MIESERAQQALGHVSYGATEAEQGSLKFRRSLYVVVNMRAGEVLTADNVRSIRPGHGLPPRHYEAVLGKVVRCDVKRGTPLSWDLL